MVWDGECGFCKYWITRWQNFTKNKVLYEPYQTASLHFEDVEIHHFKEASRLIETDGRIFSGPRSAYRTFTYGSKWAFLDRWYENNSFFSKLSDKLYDQVAKNRNFFFKVTRAFFGSNPNEPRPFWIIYLGVVLYFMYVFLS